MTTSAGSAIASLRVGKDWTIERLARVAGCSPTALRRIESGESSPRLVTLTKIAEALGCSTVDLVARGERLDLAFPLEPGRALGRLATLEARLAALVERLEPGAVGATVSVWPWLEPAEGELVVSGPASTVRLRVCPGVVAIASTLAGAKLGEAVLGVPTVQPARGGETLSVVVDATTSDSARARLVRAANSLGSLPTVVAVSSRPMGGGRAWLCRLLGVGAKPAQALVGLRSPGPVDLYWAS